MDLDAGMGISWREMKGMEKRLEELEGSRDWVRGRLEAMEKNGERAERIKKWEEVKRKCLIKLYGKKSEWTGVVYRVELTD